MKSDNPVITRFLYDIFANALAWPLFVPWYLLEAARGERSFTSVWQMLGFIRPRIGRTSAMRVMIHAVSVGEVHAAAPVIRQLLENLESLDVVLTTTTPEGFKAAGRLQKELTGITHISFITMDLRSAMAAMLEQLVPDLVGVMETELFPNLFWECRRRMIPICILSGRISPRDVWKYRARRSFFRKVLTCAEWIGVQNERERDRFVTIGAPRERTRVLGNVKYDGMTHDTRSDTGRVVNLRQPGRLIVAGSTHDPEERWMLEAFLELKRSSPDLRLILAPRHPGRSASIEQRARRLGLESACFTARRSLSVRSAVLILDELGHLPAAYRCADIAVIGGSFMKGGGHNLLEAAAAGSAIVIGPHVYHFQDIVEEFHRAGGLCWLSGHAELFPVLMELLNDEGRRSALAHNACNVLNSHCGIARSYAEALTQTLLGRKLRMSPHSLTAGTLA